MFGINVIYLWAIIFLIKQKNLSELIDDAGQAAIVCPKWAGHGVFGLSVSWSFYFYSNLIHFYKYKA